MSAPSELSEQVALARALDRAGLTWFHVPNGGRRDNETARSMKASGVKPGVPDVLILSSATMAPLGVALELKRQDGTERDVGPDQRVWLEHFRARGWAVLVAFGWRDAVAKLQALGFQV